MKKQFANFLLITGTGILLSSCSNQSKISFTKRHYRSGYYVDFGKKKNTSTISQVVVRTPVKTNCQIPSTVVAKQSNPIILNIPKANEVNFIGSKKNAKPKEVNYIKTISKVPTSTLIPGTSTSIYRNNESESEAHARVDVDIPMVVIILCAIFIPPLGVGLMYGINSYFWIDLILTLLFFVPGMIFALIVVLM